MVTFRVWLESVSGPGSKYKFKSILKGQGQARAAGKAAATTTATAANARAEEDEVPAANASPGGARRASRRASRVSYRASRASRRAHRCDGTGGSPVLTNEIPWGTNYINYIIYLFIFGPKTIYLIYVLPF